MLSRRGYFRGTRLEEVLEEAIRRQAIKLLRRGYAEAARAKRYRARFETRTGKAALPTSTTDPGYWSIAPHFDPRYCLSHSKFLARVIWKKILAGEYQPEPAAHYAIPKESGGSRDIMVFANFTADR
jgi:RNA-directed DNA polymerase